MEVPLFCLEVIMTVKQGVLKRNTFIHTSANITLKIPKGTKVTVADGSLTFNPVKGVRVTKFQGMYLICLWESWFLVVFPNGGKPPYPLSML
jgi:hypothetical protein